jgi:hypothetical protein
LVEETHVEVTVTVRVKMGGEVVLVALLVSVAAGLEDNTAAYTELGRWSCRYGRPFVNMS